MRKRFAGIDVGWVLAPTRRPRFYRVRASTHPTGQPAPSRFRRGLVLAVSLTWGAWAAVGAKAAEEEANYVPIDLEVKTTQKLDEAFHGDAGERNNLKELPQGKQTLGGVEFHVGEGCIQLGGPRLAKMPEKVPGIKVGMALKKLHVLHGTGWGGSVKDGRPIGRYVVHYDDESTQTIPIVYGVDLRDWWNVDDSREVERGKVAWEGTTESFGQGVKIRLYLATWENPHPEKTVTTISFLSTRTTEASPFCVAMTAQK